MVYRAWKAMSRLKEKAGRKEKSEHYSALAAKLKGVYRQTFFNAETGWLGWWRSANGELHDLWSDMPTGIAINYA